MPTGILEVKLGRPFQMPQKRLHKLMAAARLECCKARNAAVTHWLLWRRQHPDWKPGDPYEPPPLKIARKPKPIDPERGPPKDPPYAPRQFLSRELYRVAVATAVNLSANVASSCVQEVISRLKANTPYNHEGEARWVWQAILSGEVSLPTWRAGRIPMPSKTAVLKYTDSECSLRFPMLSKASGYTVISPTVRVEVSKLSTGRRRIVRRLAQGGGLRLADSQLIEKNGEWFAQLCYEIPSVAKGLPEDRVLTLLPALPDDKRPFVLQWTDTDGVARNWDFGNGKPLIAEYRRVQARRRAMRWRYKDGCGAGHGRAHFYRTLKPLERYVHDLESRWAKQTISDLVKRAIAEQCGAILYREPTMPVRDRSWFAGQDMPFDWSGFQARLAFTAQKHGLLYDCARIGMQEWRPKNAESAVRAS